MKKILVTGASKGIGLEIAKKFLENNFQVFGVSRDSNKIPIQDKNFSSFSADLRREEDIKSVSKFILKEGSLDILVNNAGFAHFAALENIPDEKIVDMIKLNTIAPILLTKLLLPTLKKSQGHIFNIASRAGHSGYRFGTVYCASKFGLRGFSEALFDETRNAGVRVSNISPGPVDTPFWNNLDRKPEAREGTSVIPEDVAQAVFDICQSKTAVVTESIILPQFHAMKFKKH